MKLHGNAALSWRGRRCLVERVVVGGWTLRAAAEAAGVSVSGILTRSGMGRLGRLGLEPAVRYERSRPGERGSSSRSWRTLRRRGRSSSPTIRW